MISKGITIIIPALNEARCIEKTVQSVRDALHNLEHEIIVVDVGSTDQTGYLSINILI